MLFRSGIVDRLVKCRYVARELEPEDRRVIRIRLTEKGMALVEKITGQRRRMIMNVFGRMSGKDREDYLRVILKVQEIVTVKK